jgi:hypothetical protein
MNPSTTITETVQGAQSGAKIILPDTVRETVRIFANASATARRAMAHELQEYMDQVPYGAKMTVYELIAHEWNDATGDQVTANTVRHWMRSVTEYTMHDLRRYEHLTDAQLVEAVSLATVAKVTPQDICDWAVDGQVQSVPTMRAEWLPQTSTGYEIDPPWLAGLKRTIARHIPQDDPRWQRVNELIAELRNLLISE